MFLSRFPTKHACRYDDRSDDQNRLWKSEFSNPSGFMLFLAWHSKIWFFKIDFFEINFCLIQKVANKLFVNLMVLNKFLLCYMELKPIFRKIASQKSASQKWLVSFPWINNSFPSLKWTPIRGHRGTLGFCNYKVFQKYINYNENLFRTIELYKDCSILFVFRVIFTDLQLLGKNRFWLPQKQAKILHKNPKSKNPSFSSKIIWKMIYAWRVA